MKCKIRIMTKDKDKARHESRAAAENPNEMNGKGSFQFSIKGR